MKRRPRIYLRDRRLLRRVGSRSWWHRVVFFVLRQVRKG